MYFTASVLIFVGIIGAILFFALMMWSTKMHWKDNTTTVFFLLFVIFMAISTIAAILKHTDAYTVSKYDYHNTYVRDYLKKTCPDENMSKTCEYKWRNYRVDSLNLYLETIKIIDALGAK